MTELSDQDFEDLEDLARGTERRPVPPKRLSAGTIFAGHTILGTLGFGATSVVYEARNAKEKAVALKVLDPSDARTRDFIDHLKEEAETLSKCSPHPHIVEVLGSGEHEGRPYIAMEKISGRALEEFVEPGKPLTEGHVLAIAEALTLALMRIHDSHLVHGDISAANILLRNDDPEKPVLIDFGLCRGLTEGHPTGLRAGTPGFISPEQFGGEPAQPRSDLFSLGCVIYFMLTGTRPFVRKAESGKIRPSFEATPEIPASSRIAGICRQLLQLNPSDRPESAREVHKALVVAGSSTAHRGSTIATVIVVAGILAVGAWSAWPKKVSDPQIPAAPVPVSSNWPVGRWEWSSGILEEYKADGTVVSDGRDLPRSWSGRWAFSENTLTLYRSSAGGTYCLDATKPLKYTLIKLDGDQRVYLVREDKSPCSGERTRSRPLTEEEYVRRDAERNGPKTDQEIVEAFSSAGKLLEARDYQGCIVPFKKIFYCGFDSPNGARAAYNVACAYAPLGKIDMAFEWLERAVVFGYGVTSEERAHMRGEKMDQLLLSVRSADPARFEMILGRAGKKPAWIGAQVRDADDGIRIVEIRPGSPAQAAKLQRGDVVLEISGRQPHSAMDYLEFERGCVVNANAVLLVRKGGAAVKVTVVPGDRPR